MNDEDTSSAHHVIESGIAPELAMRAGSSTPRSEAGIGALMSWADRLWAITYIMRDEGTGTGLYEIDDTLSMQKRPESVVGTYTNRMIHDYSDQLIIGPHVIDTDRNVRTFEGLLESEHDRHMRLAATMQHLENPEDLVYFLTMEGQLFEADVNTLEVSYINDVYELGGRTPKDTDRYHFKDGYTGVDETVIFTANDYHEADFLGEGEQKTGGLLEWDGNELTIVEHKPFQNINGARETFWETDTGAIFATGWDERSALLSVRIDGEWSNYRLPKASHAYDHGYNPEWTRIREVEHERFLVDCHGTFYELMPVPYGGRIWGVRPISTHLRVIPDFCSFAGMLVLGGFELGQQQSVNPTGGQPQSGLWFGATDTLWDFGKPTGWGGVWRETEVDEEVTSDPYLMTGFDQKVLHLSHESDDVVTFTVDVDPTGSGVWEEFDRISVDPNGYEYIVFPQGFSAHWIRLSVTTSCIATAHLTYT